MVFFMGIWLEFFQNTYFGRKFRKKKEFLTNFWGKKGHLSIVFEKCPYLELF